MLVIRKMEPSEAGALRKIAKGAFAWFERFFVGGTNEAMVAVLDGKLVGGIFIKYILSGGQKIGYLDTAFVDPLYHSRGIGGALYKETADYLWAQGCTTLTALVKDDNVGSWKLFLNNGFSRVGLSEGARLLGLKVMLLMYFAIPLFASNGMELYLAAKKGVAVTPKGEDSARQLGLYFLTNALLLLPAILVMGQDFFAFLCSYLALLLGGAVFAYFGTLFSKRRWNFRLNSGGALLVAAINLIGGVYPMIGGWYPSKYENTNEFRKSMGVSALCEWLFMLAATMLSCTLSARFEGLILAASLGRIFLLYRIIAIYPFESYGGGRVYRWSRVIYAALAVASAAVIVLG